VVHRGAPIPASKRSEPDASHDNSSETSEVTGRLELALSNTASACGTRLRYSRALYNSIWENTSIVGGLIRVDDVVYGLTTGHSVVSLTEDWDYEAESGTDSDSDPDSGTDSNIAGETSSSSSIMELASPHRLLGNEKNSVKGTASKEGSYTEPLWVTTTLGPFKYSRFQHPRNPNSAFSPSEASDLALIKIGAEFRDLSNKYTSPSEMCGVAEDQCTVGKISTEHPAGPLSAVCSIADVRPAYLLDGYHGYMDSYSELSTMKIQTMVPLGKSKP
jgi:hypothetical protein